MKSEVEGQLNYSSARATADKATNVKASELKHKQKVEY